MNGLLIAIVFLVAILVIWLALQSLQGRQKSGALESQMNELRRGPADHRHFASLEHRAIGETIAKSVAQRLDSVAPALQEAIKNSAQITGQMTSDAQTKWPTSLRTRAIRSARFSCSSAKSSKPGSKCPRPLRPSKAFWAAPSRVVH